MKAFQFRVKRLVLPPLPVGGRLVTEEDPAAERAMLALVDEMKRRYPIDTMRTLVTGISMGGMGAWFLANRHPRVFRAAVPLTSFPVVKHTQFTRVGLAA